MVNVSDRFSFVLLFVVLFIVTNLIVLLSYILDEVILQREIRIRAECTTLDVSPWIQGKFN